MHGTEMTQREQEQQEWVEYLKDTKEPKDVIYYQKLLYHSHYILEDLKKYKQHFIVRKLNLSGPQFSNIKPLLEAYNELHPIKE